MRLIFQPAEEIQPGGAIDMVADGAMEGVERIFALHCDPRLRVGRLGTRVGPITSACDVLEVRLTSPGGHTSRPHLTADLVEAIGLLITQLPLLLTRQVDPRSGTVLVWGAVHAGEASNAIPQHGVLRGTLRTADHATWGGLEEKVRALVAAILAPLGVGYTLDHVRGVPPVVNEAVSSEMLADAALAIGGPEASTSTEQSSGGEDFAWYLEHVPGAMARLGVWSGTGPMRDIHAAHLRPRRARPPLRRARADEGRPGRPDRPPRLTSGRRVSADSVDGESPFRRRRVAISGTAARGRGVHMPPSCPQVIRKIPEGRLGVASWTTCPFPSKACTAHTSA